MIHKLECTYNLDCLVVSYKRLRCKYRSRPLCDYSSNCPDTEIAPRLDFWYDNENKLSDNCILGERAHGTSD